MRINMRHKSIGKQSKPTDLPLAGCAVLLSLFGILLIASAVRGTASDNVMTQIFAVFIGTCLMISLSYLNYEYLLNKKVVYGIFGIAVVMLAVTLIIGTGNGNKSWIKLKGLPLSFQPSELVKVLFIITFSKHLDAVKDRINNILNVLLLALHAGIITGLVLLQGDLGSALMFLFIAVTMCFAAGLNIGYLLGGAVLTVIASPYIWSFLKPYQKDRILVGFDPESDPLGYGYQQVLSKNAISNGSFFGTGYMHSTVSPDIPYNHTDMIFSVLAEEFGLIGVVILFSLLSFLVIRIIRTAFKARKDAGAFICIGVAAMIIAQTVENVGMCLGLLPVIGITLPFISYGGSSVLSIFVAMGIVLSVYRHKSKYFFEREPS